MVPISTLAPELDHKRATVLDLMAERGIDRLLLRSQPVLAWYLGGARSHVSLLGDPIAAVLVGGDRDVVLTHGNEVDRLREEELGGLLAAGRAELVSIPWHQPLTEVGLDATDETVLTDELRRARSSLHPAEIERFADLGADCARILTEVAAEASPDLVERRIAGQIAGRLVAAGIDPAVVLVAGESRLRHRHPLPGTGTVGDRAMLVVCGRRHGLIANLTRWIRFSRATDSELDRADRLRLVEADLYTATRVGQPLSHVLAAGARSYARHGFDPDEWTRHHQGGPAGYLGRDPRATPTTAVPVVEDQAFAWNPSVPGDKIEDTVLWTVDTPRVLTRDGVWPEVESPLGLPRAMEWRLG